MKSIKSFLGRIFIPQKRPNEGVRVLLFAAGIYILLLTWAILFKFSFISQIYINSPMTFGELFLNGFQFFDFLESGNNAWIILRGFLIAFLNVLLFMPWGIYASFFYDKKRTVCFACLFSCMIECIQLFARFGVFSFEDIALNTLGAFLGILLFEKCICRLSDRTVQKVNTWTVRIGGPISALGYINVIVAMVLYFS